MLLKRSSWAQLLASGSRALPFCRDRLEQHSFAASLAPAEPGASGCLCAGFAGTPRYAAPEVRRAAARTQNCRVRSSATSCEHPAHTRMDDFVKRVCHTP
eukprot:3133103-Pleurochrysis_carterae.AAC.3